MRDSENELGLLDVSVWLFSCDASGDAFPLLRMTETDLGGFYAFENIDVVNGGPYYVNVQPSGWYALTPTYAWEDVGLTSTIAATSGEEGSVIVSNVDPSTGNTPCFELVPVNATDDGGGSEFSGIGRIVNVGLVLRNVDDTGGDSVPDVPTNAPVVGASTAIGTVAPSPPPPPSCPSPFCIGEVPIDVVVDGSSSPPRSVKRGQHCYPPPHTI
jgi:hypothetical protein